MRRLLGIFISGCVAAVFSAPHAQEPPPLRLAIAGLVHAHVSGFLRSTQGRTDVEIVDIFDPDAALLAAYAERFALDRSRAIPACDVSTRR